MINESAYFWLKNKLQAEGFTGTVSSFLSAEEALEMMVLENETKLPELILLDLDMPGMDGWEFLEELEPYKPQVKASCKIFILTSSLSLDDTDKASTNDLISGFKHKPLDATDVQEILSHL
ncbi:response regulator [Adhaeribacter aquaticus]|uniref:response regulator n=1 Tax=Adhaeribacter aquaticus TaxID=299567 RepID=UPI0003FC2B6C|nr:response regulator [Adhaeribacter aquaticus]